MANDDKGSLPGTISGADAGSNKPSATFGQQMPNNNVLVNVTADNLNIHPSSLTALERIAEKSPEIASQLIEASNKAVEIDGRKYLVAAVSSALVALAIILGSAWVIVKAGAFSGLFFFLACVAACAVMVALLTGKAQDLSWTVNLLPHNRRGNDTSNGDVE